MIVDRFAWLLVIKIESALLKEICLVLQPLFLLSSDQ